MMDQKIPITNLPIEDGMHKFVQARIGGVDIMYFGDAKTTTHSVILENILANAGIGFTKTKGKWGVYVPDLSGPNYKVDGMGISNTFNSSIHIIDGKSEEYGIGHDEDHLLRMNQLGHGFHYWHPMYVNRKPG